MTELRFRFVHQQGCHKFWQKKAWDHMTDEELVLSELELSVHLGNCREAFLKGVRTEHAAGNYTDEDLQRILDRFPNT